MDIYLCSVLATLMPAVIASEQSWSAKSCGYTPIKPRFDAGKVRFHFNKDGGTWLAKYRITAGMGPRWFWPDHTTLSIHKLGRCSELDSLDLIVPMHCQFRLFRDHWMVCCQNGYTNFNFVILHGQVASLSMRKRIVRRYDCIHHGMLDLIFLHAVPRSCGTVWYVWLHAWNSAWILLKVNSPLAIVR